MTLTNKMYNIIKYVITIFLPAVGALYYGLAQVWDFDRIPGVNGTINVLITFGGLLIGYSTRKYNQIGPGAPDGDLVMHQDPVDKTIYPTLGIKTSLEEMASKDKVTLTILKPDTDTKLVVPPGLMNPATKPESTPPPAA